MHDRAGDQADIDHRLADKAARAISGIGRAAGEVRRGRGSRHAE